MKMLRSRYAKHKHSILSFKQLENPLAKILKEVPQLVSRGNRPLQMEFKDQLSALIFFHLEEHTSGRHLIQSLNEDEFAREPVSIRRVRQLRNKILNESREAEAQDLQNEQYCNNSAQSIQAST